MSTAQDRSATDDPGAVGPTRAAVALLVLGSLAYGWLLFAWFSLPAYLPTIRTDLGLTATEAGILAGAVPLTYVPLGLVSGALTDRLGGERAVGAGVTIVAVAQLLRSGAGGFGPMLAATLLLGVGGTGITFGLPKLVADRFPERLVGRASSVYLVGSTLGTATAFGLGRPTLGPALGGWRPFFGATGAVVLVFAAGWWLAVVLAERGDASPETGSDSGEGSLAALRAVARTPAVALLVVIGFVYLFVVHGLQGWLTAVLEARGAGPTLAARVTTLLVVAQLIGTVALAPLADRAVCRPPVPPSRWPAWHWSAAPRGLRCRERPWSPPCWSPSSAWVSAWCRHCSGRYRWSWRASARSGPGPQSAWCSRSARSAASPGRR